MMLSATPTALPRVHSGASLRSRAVLCRASLGEDAPDLFDELGVSPSDSAEELRAAYLRQIRLCHPDVAGAAGTERSVRLNAAYDVLSDASKRARYLASQSGAAFSRSRGSARGASAGPARREGVVGPLRQLRLLTRLLPRLGASGLAPEEVRDSVRDYLKTLAFTTELPLPLPLQVDETPSGVRVAFCELVGGRLQSQGELLFAFQLTECQAEDKQTCDWDCTVTRCSSASDADRPLPGEARILAAFLREFNSLLEADGQAARPLMLPAWLSALSAFILPALPVGLGMDGPGAGQYRQYNLRRSCRLEERPQEEEAK